MVTMQGLLRFVWCRLVGVDEAKIAGYEPRHMVAYLGVQLREQRARAERAEKDRDLSFGILRQVLEMLHADPNLGPALREGGWLVECWRTLEAAERRCWVDRGDGNGDGGGVEALPW